MKESTNILDKNTNSNKMNIYEQIKEVLKEGINELVKPSILKKMLKDSYGTNPNSIILSDYCYNRYNKGIPFNKHLFEYINRSSYRYIGEKYPYTGLILHQPKGYKKEIVIGEWIDGKKLLHKKTSNETYIDNQNEIISKNQIINLYNEYNRILRYELNLLDCKPTEVRHLIGRIGEFICALETDGMLARQPNQHGFDVTSNGRRISVKTTAQLTGFISINKNTFNNFDDFFVIQYINDNFKVVFYGAKEEVQKISRVYGTKYEVDILRLKKLNSHKEYRFVEKI